MILHYNDLIVNVQYLTCSAPLGLLFTLYQPYIRRIDVDGTNSLTLYSSGTPFAVDYDYRCVSCLRIIMPFVYYLQLWYSHRNNYLFWSDVNADRIWRAGLDGSNPMILVNTGVPCVGKHSDMLLNSAMFTWLIVKWLALLLYRWASMGLGEPKALLDRLLWWWHWGVWSCNQSAKGAVWRGPHWTQGHCRWSYNRVSIIQV